MNKKLKGILYSVGPQAIEIAAMILQAAEEKDIDKLLPILKELADYGWRREASEYAKMNVQVKETTRQMHENTHPTNFIADGGIVFYRNGESCPHCDGGVVSSKFCSQIKEAHADLPYGGVIMCTNNIFVKAQTDGTGECEYEAWLPETKKQEA